jgi:hypothetical protein
MVCNRLGTGCSTTLNAQVVNSGCVDTFGCPPDGSGICPDFTIRRHDTKPDFKVSVEDCDGPLDLTDLILEANMWANAKLKAAIDENDTYFGLADNIGFDQIMMDDIIIMDRVRLPEHMLVTGFDETNNLVRVQRGYNGTVPSSWPKGNGMKIFRIINAPAATLMVREDIAQPDGTTETDVLIDSFLVYEWKAPDTCLPGCFYLEFKLMKELVTSSMVQSLATINPSFTPSTLTPADFGCSMPLGLEWIRRFPVDKEGFLIRITNSPTTES